MKAAIHIHRESRSPPEADRVELDGSGHPIGVRHRRRSARALASVTTRQERDELALSTPAAARAPALSIRRALLSRRRAASARRLRSRRTLLAADLVAFLVAYGAALAAGAGRARSLGLTIAAGVVVAVGGLALAQAYGMYSRDAVGSDHTTADDIPHIGHVALVVSVVAAVVLARGIGRIAVQPLLVLFGVMLVAMVAGRGLGRALSRRRPGFVQATVIVGAGSVGQLLAAKLINRPVHGYRLLGFVDDVLPTDVDPRLGEVPLLGSVERLPELIVEYDVERVIVAFSRHSHERTLELLRSLRNVSVHVDVVPRLFDAIGPSAGMHTIDGLPLIGTPHLERSQQSMVAKRAFDLFVATVGLVLLAPIVCLLAALVKCDSPGPAFYSAERIGRDGVGFRQLKFRTMRTEFCDGPRYGGESARVAFQRLLEQDEKLRHDYERTHKLETDPRVTRVGCFLRATSLDELPQLLNVIRGELSLVGPRPVTEPELSRYGEHVTELLSVRPGLTGYWQISGRSALGYDERVRLDLAYVKAWSLGLDLRILLKSSNLLTTRTRAV
jgi:exopolysaccharide biosynthesis polyprenyl glycosylphosphotransferase